MAELLLTSPHVPLRLLTPPLHPLTSPYASLCPYIPLHPLRPLTSPLGVLMFELLAAHSPWDEIGQLKNEMQADAHAHTHMHMHTRTRTRTQTHTHTHAHATCTCTNTRMHACECTRMHACVRSGLRGDHRAWPRRRATAALPCRGDGGCAWYDQRTHGAQP